MDGNKNDTGYVFVYGTLKVNDGDKDKGYYAEMFDEYRESSESARIQGKLYNMGFFPALVSGGDSTVYGELHKYRKYEKVIKIMDQIEGFIAPGHSKNLYNRVEVDVTVKGGRTIKAVVYEFARSISKGTPSVADGEWSID